MTSLKKRRRRTLFVAIGIVIGVAAASYTFWTRVSALLVLRWFVKEAGIPVEVRSASWRVGFKALTRGSIDELAVKIYYPPLRLEVSLSTPVNYVKREGRWSVRLEPIVRLGTLPGAKGRINLDINRDLGAKIGFFLRETEAVRLRSGEYRLGIESWTAEGDVNWNPLESEAKRRWASTLDLNLKNIKTEVKGGGISAATATIKATLNWPTAPPLPLKADARIILESVQWLSEKIFALEPKIDGVASFTFDGRRFAPATLSTEKPLRLRLEGMASPSERSFDARVDLSAPLAELVNDRLSSWLENVAPIAQGAKARGQLKLRGALSSREGALRGAGQVDLDIASLKLPAKSLTLEGLKVKAPLSYPSAPAWGRLSMTGLDFHSVKLKDVAMDVRLAPDSISLTTEGDDARDRPIRQNAWGGTINIAELYADLPFAEDAKPELTAAVTGGPFSLHLIQNDLCLLPEKPLRGSLSFTYPKIVQDKTSLRMIGDTNLVAFNGAAHVGDIHLDFSGDTPKLLFDLDWSDLDLYAIGEYTSFGDMRGSLDGSLSNTTLALTPIGPVPLSYDLTVKGRERGGKKIRFYGRAIDNILAMLGSPQEGAGPAGLLLKFATTWRNWMPATAEYMGFRAKSDGSWTELLTFDPPDSKKHYILYGATFTIPMNSHGIYPVRIKTAAFHGWLAGMIQYFKGRAQNDDQKQSRSSCTPLF